MITQEQQTEALQHLRQQLQKSKSQQTVNDFLQDLNEYNFIRKIDELSQQISPAVSVRLFSSNEASQLIESLLSLTFEKILKMYSSNDENDSYNSDDDNSEVIEEDVDKVSFYSALQSLNWIPSPSHHTGHYYRIKEPLLKTVRKYIQSKVEVMAGDLDEQVLQSLFERIKDKVLAPFFNDMYEAFYGLEMDDYDWKGMIDKSLVQEVATSFCRLRRDQLFDILVSYPDSQIACTELRDAFQILENEELHNISQSLITSMKCSLHQRLLHPGATTQQLLEVYISLIQVLRNLDPSDRSSLLSEISKPVKAYLYNRKDTIRCIVSSLTDKEDGGELYNELQRQDAKLLDDVGYGDEDFEEPTEHWQPRSRVFSKLSSIGVATKRNDLLSMLVGIYGSKELFVDEYRMILADRLLENVSFNTDDEVHTLELLKLRFGEESLITCEIMIKDLNDSKRINSNIHTTAAAALRSRQSKLGRRIDRSGEGLSEPLVVDATIVSDVFWPELERDSLKIYPERIQEQMKMYDKEYAKLKNPRRLIFFENLGLVQLELEVTGDDGVMSKKAFNCSPLQASLICHFEDKEIWTSSELSNETGISENGVIKAMLIWITNQVVAQIKEERTSLVYKLRTDVYSGSAELASTQHASSNVISKMNDDWEDLQPYIINMLRVYGSLSLQRIHSMLESSSGTAIGLPDFNKTHSELSAFLKRLCTDGVIIFRSSDNEYQIKN